MLFLLLSQKGCHGYCGERSAVFFSPLFFKKCMSRLSLQGSDEEPSVVGSVHFYVLNRS